MVWPGSPFPRKLDAGLQFAIALIMIAVGMVLVIACANVACLQLARAASRQGELGMRLSLGASRVRLIRQLLTESALLGVAAGAIALLFSWAMLRAGVAAFTAELPAEYGTLTFNVNPDAQVFAYVFGISVLAGILFGLAPALESSRSALSSALKANTDTSPARKRRMRDLLIAAQVAVSLVLMIAGGLLIHSSIRALTLDTGYDVKNALSVQLHFPDNPTYPTERKTALYREVRSRLAALPGVTDTTSGRAPDGGGVRSAAISLNGEEPNEHNTQAWIFYSYVQSNYLHALGIPILYGRGFDEQGSQSAQSVIVSESVAKELWPGQNPIGHRLRMNTDRTYHDKGELLPDGPAYEVIGVARDTRGVQIDNSDAAQVYVPLPANRLEDYPILIRTSGDPAQMFNSIGTIVTATDPNLVADTNTLEQLLRTSPPFVVAALSAGVATIVGLMGLLLASMGIYGTVSYMVVLRTREVGIRMALGAKKGDVLRLMMRESARPVLIGLAAGVVLSMGASYLLRGVLYGVNRLDGISFGGVSMLFLVIAFVATWLPSRRATRVQPMSALRCE
jgi:predicted permease